MPNDLRQEKIDTGKVLAHWSFPEFIKHQYSRSWYIGALTIIGLLLLYCIFTANILFAFIIIITVGIFYLNRRRMPEEIKFKITEEGLVLDQQLYQWPEIKYFWIVYEPPEVKTLYFEFKSFHLPRLPIPLQDQEPVKIREMLLDFIDEDIEREGEPISDNISRNLKI